MRRSGTYASDGKRKYVDDVTIAAARGGDRQAQARLLTALQDSWYRMCLSLLRDAELARDAAQETALRFLRQLPSFRGQSQLSTWSLGIAINVSREFRRSARPTVEWTEQHAARADESHGSRPGEGAEAAEHVRLLHASLADLPERQREAVVLRYFEELSTEDTASVMNCAPGTVKATLHQALRKLRERLTMLVL